MGPQSVVESPGSHSRSRHGLGCSWEAPLDPAPCPELQEGTAETLDDAGSGNSRTEQMQGTAARIIAIVVANKNANKCTLRKNGLHVNKSPARAGLPHTAHLISFAEAFHVSGRCSRPPGTVNNHPATSSLPPPTKVRVDLPPAQNSIWNNCATVFPQSPRSIHTGERRNLIFLITFWGVVYSWKCCN